MLLKKQDRVNLCTVTLLGLFVLFAGGTIAFGQATGTLLGVIHDQSGAVLPGVTVVVKNVETGISRTAMSGNRGEFQVAALPPGSYQVQAQMTGFQTGIRCFKMPDWSPALQKRAPLQAPVG